MYLIGRPGPENGCGGPHAHSSSNCLVSALRASVTQPAAVAGHRSAGKIFNDCVGGLLLKCSLETPLTTKRVLTLSARAGAALVPIVSSTCSQCSSLWQAQDAIHWRGRNFSWHFLGIPRRNINTIMPFKKLHLTP